MNLKSQIHENTNERDGKEICFDSENAPIHALSYYSRFHADSDHSSVEDTLFGPVHRRKFGCLVA